MKLTQIAGGDCGRDDCPTIFTTAGEAVVEIPLAVFQEAIRAPGK